MKMSDKITGIVDIPLKDFEKDLLQMTYFEEALKQYIMRASTPMTIGLQGEWGSGKTSLMNRLDNALCKSDDSEFYSVWLNTWHFALLNKGENIFVEIISSLIQQVIDISSKEHPEKFKNLISNIYSVGKNLFKGLSKMAIKAAVSQISEQAAEDVDKTFFGEKEESFSLNDLRNNLAELVNQTIVKNKENAINKKAFIFFIDDLDRIEPHIAVTILELMKNLFDINHCIFVLAIDYEVVVKGLKHKFGEMSTSNEREFRSFFDKIIQLPFQMPVQSYIIDEFLKESLLTVDFLSAQEAANENIIKTITAFSLMTVGTNPRSIKRLVNTLSFINLLVSSKNKFCKEVNELNSTKKIILFSLAAMQVAYPAILNLLSDNHDFENWSDEFSKKHSINDNNKDIENDSVFLSLKEQWKRILFSFCNKSVYLRKQFFNIVGIFRLIQQVCEDANENMNDILSEMLDYLSVTNLNVDFKPQIEINNIRVLVALNEKLLPVLQSKISAPLQFVERKGRIIAKLSYTFNKKVNNSISIYLFVQQNYIYLKVGTVMKLFKKQGLTEDGIKNLQNLGKIENFNQIIAELDDLLIKHKTFKFFNKPKKGLLVRNDEQLFEQYFQFSTQNIEILYSKNFIESLSNFIIDFMNEVMNINQIVWIRNN